MRANAIFLSTRNRGAAPAGVLDFAVGVRNADAYAVWQEEADEGIWRRIASRGLSDQYRHAIPANSSVNLKRVHDIEDLQSNRLSDDDSLRHAVEAGRSMIVVPQ